MIFYTGSYTIKAGSPASNPIGKGISRFELDLETGQIKQLGTTAQRSPSYLAISPDKQFLYAAEEGLEELSPHVFCYRIEEGGKLSPINSQPINGAYSCHLEIVGRQLVVANYATGNAMIFPIREDGKLLAASQTITHTGSGSNPERQESAHIHMVCPKDSRHIFLPDLGLDRAVAYSINQDYLWEAVPEQDIELPPCTGARQMVFNTDRSVAYIIGELSGEICVYKNRDNLFSLIQQVSTVPREHTGVISGAAIRMHPDGRTIYASERGSSTISVFNVDLKSGGLTLQKCVSSHGRTPRDFNIDPTGSWLLAANQDSDNIAVFRIITGGLPEYVSETQVNTPANITFL